MDFGNIINNLLNQMAFFHLGAGNYVMIVVALVFLYLAIRKGFEPLLLIPIAFGKCLSGYHVFSGTDVQRNRRTSVVLLPAG